MTNDRDAKQLDAAFAAARTGMPAPSDDLLNRIMMDADTVLADTVTARPQARPRPTWRQNLFDAIGGWSSLSGLAAATVAGLWIGVSPPAALGDITALLTGETLEVSLWEADILSGLEG